MNEALNYIDILMNTLYKKCDVLCEIEKIASQQYALLCDNDNPNPDNIIKQLEKKDELLKKLEELDNGFEAIYERVRVELSINKENYKKEIEEMQKCIREISDYTVKLQVLEEKNRVLYTNLFDNKKKEIKSFKINNKTASRYYKNMSRVHQEGQTYFLDEKK